ncbi:MAG: glycerol kinase [Faecousia sp.]
MSYILAIDQSTQATKAFLVDSDACIIRRASLPHRQRISPQGWVSHDLEEIYVHLLDVVRQVTEGIDKSAITCVGISNQRETACAWNREGKPLSYAVVWQCSRAKELVEALNKGDFADTVKQTTGLSLSPYYAGPKFAWLLQNVSRVRDAEDLHFGTVDSFLLYRLTGQFRTDVTNASRTMLMDLEKLRWDDIICAAFGIPQTALPEIMPCDAVFGETDFDGILPHTIPVTAVMGDSHAAFFAQRCTQPGDTKVTYGTGSSVMMNIGQAPRPSGNGIVNSVGYSYQGRLCYAFEGNINYSAAVITWLKDQVKLIDNPGETEALAFSANPQDTTILVPAFSGLSAPYNQPQATAILTGMTRLTGKNEIVRAALESIAFQIQDITSSMEAQSGKHIGTLYADGGAVRNRYLMQFQADISGSTVCASTEEALSALGVAQMAGRLTAAQRESTTYTPTWPEAARQEKKKQWAKAVRQCGHGIGL